MKKVLSALLLTACSGGVDDLSSATRPDFQAGLVCGWIFKHTVDLGPTETPGTCWLVKPPPGMSIMEHGAAACDAGEGTVPRVWGSAEKVDLFTRTGSSGDMPAPRKEVPCN